jgi:[acyl-carrier-protein] S-malonyltransferase
MSTAIMFPGQGSQSVGMGLDLYEGFPAAAAVIDTADEITGRSLSRLMFEGPAEALTDTINAQSAIYVINHACFVLFKERGGEFSMALGHSLGEYNALTAAGVIDFAEALSLIEKRAALMQAAATRSPGKMLAVLGLDDEAVDRITADNGGNVTVANYNSPGQVIVSGDNRAVEAAAEAFKAAGARKVIELKVSGAFHSPLMREAETGMAGLLDETDFKQAEMPVCPNFTSEFTRDAAALKDALKMQITGSVKWTSSVRAASRAGADKFIEIGPGAVLSGLAKRILGPEAEIISLNNFSSFEGFRTGTS